MNSVFKASSVEQADIVVAWLADRGIPAFVKNRNMAANYVSLAVAPRGVEVCVVNPDQAEMAISLLKDQSELIKERHLETSEKVISIICSECGRRVEFPGELYGTVQSCPACKQNVDVENSPHFC